MKSICLKLFVDKQSKSDLWIVGFFFHSISHSTLFCHQLAPFWWISLIQTCIFVPTIRIRTFSGLIQKLFHRDSVAFKKRSKLHGPSLCFYRENALKVKEWTELQLYHPDWKDRGKRKERRYGDGVRDDLLYENQKVCRIHPVTDYPVAAIFVRTGHFRMHNSR